MGSRQTTISAEIDRIGQPVGPRSPHGDVSASGPSVRPMEFPLVAIGISAGGLDTFQRLLDALPADPGMAFIVVSLHESALPGLLGSRTSLIVRQVAEGTVVEPNYLYVVPPSSHFAVERDTLTLKQPKTAPSAFDFLLGTLAFASGPRVVAVILSGTSADGILGLKAVKESGGFIIAQDPEDAAEAGSIHNAIATGLVDLILPLAAIPRTLTAYVERIGTRALSEPIASSARDAAFADLSHRLVLEMFGPATVLINRQHECLYFLGPMDRYLRVAPGHPTHDLLAMAHVSMRATLRAAIRQAIDENRKVTAPGGAAHHEGSAISFTIVVQPVPDNDDGLLLVSFVDEVRHGHREEVTPGKTLEITLLERELEATRLELQNTIRAIELANQQQMAISDDLLSANEEHHATNEELLAAKEELQSFNDELRTINAQLRDNLDRQRGSADDLRDVLNSTGVPTLFLDADLNIRFFTPATASLFHIIPGDIGRPLTDLMALAEDDIFVDHARRVLLNAAPLESEIETSTGSRYLRRISPYRNHGDTAEGLVVTFMDVTERYRVTDTLITAKEHAEQASAAKSRSLASISHDLRQSLQTLSMLQRLLATAVNGGSGAGLVVLLERNLEAMSNMMETLLGINKIDTSAVQIETADISIANLFAELREEFIPQATASAIEFRVISSTLSVISDPVFLEQMIRHALSYALTHVERGKLLLGCRRRRGRVNIEIWSTSETQAVSDTEPNLGFAVVDRLGTLLGHPVNIRSHAGGGSTLTIEITTPHEVERAPPIAHQVSAAAFPAPPQVHATGRASSAVDNIDPLTLRSATVYIVDDDDHVRHAIRGVLLDDGWTTEDFSSCEEFLEHYRRGGNACLIIDAHLPGISGIDLLRRLKESGDAIPSIMITGKSDVPMAIQAMKAGAVDFIEKPVGAADLIGAVVSALEQNRNTDRSSPLRQEAVKLLSRLTTRQRQVLDQVLAGQPSKNIAVDLGISQRTVEFHRAAIIKKTGAKSLPALARLALAAK